MGLLGDLFLLVELVDDLDIIREGSLQMDIMLQCFMKDEGKMRTLGAVTIIILAFVFMLFHGMIEHGLRLVDLHTDLWKIGEFERGSVLVNQVTEVKAVELQATIFDLEAFLREIECLLDKVGVGITHVYGRGLFVMMFSVLLSLQ
jgi:hypothetical protein